MSTLISILLFIIFLLLSSIHIYWAFGGKWGQGAIFPTSYNNTKTIMPGFLPTIIVAIGLLIVAIFILIKSTLLSIDIPLWIDKYGLWIITAIFIIRGLGDFNYVGVFKKVKDTKFGINDTKYYTPLCFLIGILTIVLEMLN